jgi:hypothetical protein
MPPIQPASIGQKGFEHAIQEVRRKFLPGIAGNPVVVVSVPVGSGLVPDREERGILKSTAGTTRAANAGAPHYTRDGKPDDFGYNVIVADTLISTRSKAVVLKDAALAAQTEGNFIYSGDCRALVWGKTGGWVDTALKKGDKIALVTGQEGGADANSANCGTFRLAAANDMAQGYLAQDVAAGASGLADIVLYSDAWITPLIGNV